MLSWSALCCKSQAVLGQGIRGINWVRHCLGLGGGVLNTFSPTLPPGGMGLLQVNRKSSCCRLKLSAFLAMTNSSCLRLIDIIKYRAACLLLFPALSHGEPCFCRDRVCELTSYGATHGQ